jgi:hypothetical protein
VATDEPEKPAGEAEENAKEPSGETEQERPTVSPPFDPVAFAKQQLQETNPHTKVTPAGGFRAPAPTYTDPDQLEEARRKSLETAGRKATPTGALSLVNTRVPSNLPPATPSRVRTLSSMNAVDRDWSELEVATRPPPAGQNPEDFDIPPPPPAAADLAPKAEKKSIREEGPPTEQEMNDRVSLGDYTGALAIAEKLLALDPDHAAVKACAETCRTVLRQMYTAQIGPLDRVPVVAVPRDQLRWLTIDHRAGFVLSLVDGVSSLEMILDVSGMPELDALRILCELAQQRILSFR